MANDVGRFTSIIIQVICKADVLVRLREFVISINFKKSELCNEIIR